MTSRAAAACRTTGPGAVSTVAVSRDTGFAMGVRHVTPLDGPIACPVP